MNHMDDIQALVVARQWGRSGEGRRRREAADLSLREVAGAIGVDPATLWRWETGRNRPWRHHAALWVRVISQATGSLSASWQEQEVGVP